MTFASLVNHLHQPMVANVHKNIYTLIQTIMCLNDFKEKPSKTFEEKKKKRKEYSRSG